MMMATIGSVKEVSMKRQYYDRVGVAMKAPEMETLKHHMSWWELGWMGEQHSCVCLGFKQ